MSVRQVWSADSNSHACLFTSRDAAPSAMPTNMAALSNTHSSMAYWQPCCTTQFDLSIAAILVTE